MVESQTMRLPSEDSTTEPKKVPTKLTEQEVIYQTQAELVGLMRSPERAMEWQHSVRLGNWSGTLESEIYHSLW